jgi:hypothetical protein
MTNRPDPLKHFAKDGVLARLIALFIDRLPLMLGACSGLAAAAVLLYVKSR